MKRARIAPAEPDDNVSDDSSVEEDEGDNEEVGGEEVQLELEAQPLCDADAPALRRLLGQLFLKWPVELAQLVDALIGQSDVGSVLKQLTDPEDDDEEEIAGGAGMDEPILALCSALSLDRDECKALKETLMQRSTRLGELLHRPEYRVGLLLNERVVNLPSSVATPMLRSLLSELATAKSRQSRYDFTHFLLVCKTCRQRPGKQQQQQKEPMQFLNEEEEALVSCAELTHHMSVASERSDAGWGGGQRDLEQFRTFLLVSKSNLENFVKGMVDT